jgi:hypothetical protein
VKVWDVLVEGEPITRETLVGKLTRDTPDGGRLDHAALAQIDKACPFDVSTGFLWQHFALAVAAAIRAALPAALVEVRERDVGLAR